MPTTRGGLMAAALYNKQDTGQIVYCMFNPNEYTLSKQNQWTQTKKKGKNVPGLTFEQGGPQTLRLQLFFDTYTGRDDSSQDVRTHTDKLWQLMMIESDKKNQGSQKSTPPPVVFEWGAGLTFTGVITDMSQKFTLFSRDGVPLRATVDLTLRQWTDEDDFGRQNPTSGGGETHKIRLAQAGERLDWIAFQEYGDAAEWRRIAQANRLTDPLHLRPGQRLLIPPLI